MADNELLVKVESPDKVLWEGHASAVSATNSIGPFDILPDHANMITLLSDSPITIVTADGEKFFKFAKAVLSVHHNTVSIYTDIIASGLSPSS